MNEHKEHIAVRPVGDARAAFLLDGIMDLAHGVNGSVGLPSGRKNNPAGVPDGGEQPRQRISGQSAGKVEPIHSFIQRKFRRRSPTRKPNANGGMRERCRWIPFKRSIVSATNRGLLLSNLKKLNTMLKMLTISLFFLLISACTDKSENTTTTKEPKLLAGLSLQQYKNSRPRLDGYVDGLDYAVKNGINIFGMSPEWNILEPSPNTYALQDNLTNPLTLIDPGKTKLKSYVLVLKMIDTNIKLLPNDITNLNFDSPEVISRFLLLLERIFPKSLQLREYRIFC